jgi:ElaB/YqjD/DUF883 family membrane-anchored ribosome-binding protein
MYKEPGNRDNNDQDKKEIEKIRKIITYELEDIKEELMEELADIHEDFEDEIEDLKDAKDDIKQELIEELQDLQDERNYLLREIGDTAKELETLGEGAKEQVERASEKLEQVRKKIEKQKEKYHDKMRKKLEKAQKKAAKRINISVDEDTSDEWRNWSEELGSSVSELIRKSMKFVKDNIGDLSKLDEIGDSIERAVKESGIEDLGDKIEREFKGKKIKPKIKINLAVSDDKDRIKKRVRGLIKLQNSLPIDKLAQALNRSNEDAENLIYELVDEGIEGSLEEGVFKFKSAPEDVISKINELLDKM